MATSEVKTSVDQADTFLWGNLTDYQDKTKNTLNGFGERLKALTEIKEKALGGESAENFKKVAEDLLKLNEELSATIVERDALLKKANEDQDIAKSGHGKIYYSATKSINAVTPFLLTLKKPEVKDGEEAKEPTIDQEGFKRALEAMVELQKYLEDHPKVNSTTPEKIKSENKPQPSKADVDTRVLGGKLIPLHQDLNTLMKGVNAKTDIEGLKLQYAEKKMMFDALVKNAEDLAMPVKGILDRLEEQVETYNREKIPSDAIKFCAIAKRCTEQEILRDLDHRKKVNDERIARHDVLAKAWATVLIEKEAIEWELKRIEIRANIFTEVDNLHTKLSQLAGKIEDTKKLLRDQVPPVAKNPEDLKKLLDSTVQTLSDHYVLYDECKVLGSTHRLGADSTIKSLTELKEKGGKELNKALNEIKLFDDVAKKNILTESQKAVGILQDERQALLIDLQNKWATVFKHLDLCDTKSSLAFELVRLCYTCEKNSGTLPATSLYKWWGGWTPEKEPVKSPWIVVEDKKPEAKPETPKTESKKDDKAVETKPEAAKADDKKNDKAVDTKPEAVKADEKKDDKPVEKAEAPKVEENKPKAENKDVENKPSTSANTEVKKEENKG